MMLKKLLDRHLKTYKYLKEVKQEMKCAVLTD